MELEGFKRGLRFLIESGIKVKAVVTDQHSSIQKYMREIHSKTIEHYFDIWHISKGNTLKI